MHLPTGEETTIFEASQRYLAEGTPLIVLAGKEYGSGSSRDWAAKGPNLLGVRAVIAESYERIHRSNLLMMGILPLQFLPGETRGVARAHRPRGVLDRRRRERRGERGDGAEPTRRSSAPASGSTPRASASTCATAASSRSCCGGCSLASTRCSNVLLTPSQPDVLAADPGSSQRWNAVRRITLATHSTRGPTGASQRLRSSASRRNPIR